MKRFAIVLFIMVPIVAFSQRSADFSRDVENFSKIKASNGVKVNLINGTPGTVQIRTRNIDLHDLVVEVHGKTLKLSIDAWSTLRENPNRWEVEVDVPIRSLSGITCVTGAVVSSDFQLSGRDLKITGNTGGELYLDLNYADIFATASTGAILKLKGDAENLEISSSMGSEVEANRLRADYVWAKAGMGGVLEVYARREIHTRATFGGEIEVFGNPDRTHTSKSMGGEIKGIR